MKCGDCTLCCKLIDIPWMKSPPLEYCSKCVPERGCGIWDNVPKDCLEYECAYREMDKASVNLRPDKCHVIFEKLSGLDTFLGLLDPGYSMGEDVHGQINAFVNDGFSVFVSAFGRSTPLIISGNGKASKDIYNEVKNLLDKR